MHQRKIAGRIAAALIALLSLGACGGGGDSGGGGGGSTNVAPIANAGAPRTVDIGSVTLNGTASSDSDGTIATYAWAQTAGNPVTLNAATTAQPNFVAAQSTVTVVLTFRLIVTDNRGATSSPSSVTITVNGNAVPVANAGAPQTVTAGATVSLNGTASSDANGTIASYSWSQTGGPAVTLGGATIAQPTFVAPQVSTATVLTFGLVVADNLGAVSSTSTVQVTVSAPVTGNVTITGKVQFARVGYLATSPFGLNYAAPTLRPARGVVVRVVDAGTQATLATSATDASGNYSLTVLSNLNVAIQVVAQMQRDSSQPLPRWNVRVQNGITGTAPYNYTTAPFSSNAGTKNVDVPTGIASSGNAPPQVTDRASGPFAILDTIYTAVQKIVSVEPSANFPELIVDWGVQTVGTHFFPPSSGTQYIRLLADLTEDADEFDQHVIAHEFGHYIEHNFSRADNIGGSHALGDKLDMRVAFGEGFGYAFAAIVLDDPVVRDGFVNAGTQVSATFNVETNPVNGCWCSESSVAAIFWDLYDTGTEGTDNITVPFSTLWSLLVTSQRVTPAFTSIFSYITALRAAQPALNGVINSLVSSQNINSSSIDAFATTEVFAPFSGMLPLYANISKGGGPVSVRSIDDGGYYNKAGNGGYYRFVPAVSGPVTVSLTTTNTDAARDPDFVVWNTGVAVRLGFGGSAEYPETETFNVTAGQTYVIEAYDCANGCDVEDSDNTPPGVHGDYTLTMTIN